MAVMNISEALRNAIQLEMRRDPRVYCIGEDEDIPMLMRGRGGSLDQGCGSEYRER